MTTIQVQVLLVRVIKQVMLVIIIVLEVVVHVLKLEVQQMGVVKKTNGDCFRTCRGSGILLPVDYFALCVFGFTVCIVGES